MRTHSNSPKQKHYDPDANVYIAGLPRNYNKDKLYQLFSAYGPVLRYKFVSPKDETKCPYGFVQFSHPICAQQAIKALNGYIISKKESIEVSIAAVGRRALFKSDEPTNLYIENMPSLWNNDILSSVFGKYGNIIQSKITGNNVAFVRFETHEQALNAINHLHREEIEPSKRLTVRFATCQHKKNNNNIKMNKFNNIHNMYNIYNNMNKSNIFCDNNNNNLYVKNLPSTYNQLDLERLFSAFGAISSATIINDSIGVAFVRYKHSENARRAVKELNGTKPKRFEKEIVVKYAHSDIDKERKHNKAVNATQYIHNFTNFNNFNNFNSFMLPPTHIQQIQELQELQQLWTYSDRKSKNKYKVNKLKNMSAKNKSIIYGYIRDQQRLCSITFNIGIISDIIYLYFDEPYKFNDECFDDLLGRINTFDDTLEIIQNSIYGINNKINNLLSESEQQRMYEMNFMQKQFTDIIAKLCNKMNNELQNMSNMLHDNIKKENRLIESLEKQIYELHMSKDQQNKHMKTMQCTINHLNNVLFDRDREKRQKVRVWLKDTVHLQQYYNLFITNGYDDMESIVDLNDNDLIHIGIDKIGHKKKILKYAKQLCLQWQGCNNNICINNNIYNNNIYNKEMNGINELNELPNDRDIVSNYLHSNSSSPISWACWNCRCYNITTLNATMKCSFCGHKNNNNDSVEYSVTNTIDSV